MNYIYLLIAFILVLFLYNSFDLVENMENKENTNLGPQAIIYKNQGAISNLQKNVKDIMSQLSKNVGTSGNQNLQLNTLRQDVSNNKTTSDEAKKLANSNKESIMKIVNAQKEQATKFKKNAEGVPEIGPSTLSKNANPEMMEKFNDGKI